MLYTTKRPGLIVNLLTIVIVLLATANVWAANCISATIDHTKIDAALNDFPVLIHLSDNSGMSQQSAEDSFNELRPQGWRYMREIELAAPTTRNNTPLFVKLGAWFDYPNANTDGGDIRFYDKQHNKLKYHLDAWNHGGDSRFIVKVPHRGTARIYMYYGNPDAASEAVAIDSILAKHNWPSFRAGWRYSGHYSGRKCGWESQLAKYAFNDGNWSKVSIHSDYVPDVTNRRWFVRKKFYAVIH